MDVAKQIENMFDEAPAIRPGPSPADAHRARVQKALEGHAERVAEKQGSGYGFQPKPCDFLGIQGAPPAPRKKKRDLNARARAAIRRLGLIPDRRERWNDRLGIHQDWLGAFDFQASNETRHVAIQVTTRKNANARRLKMIETGAIEKAKRRGFEVALLLFENPGEPRQEVWEWL
jgi:hypothetical protein